MFKYLFIAILGLTVAACAEPVLTREDDFFGIPNVDSLSMDWFIGISDSTDYGFIEPRDIEVIRLSEADYRMVILDAYGGLFLQFRIDQQNGLLGSDLVHSGVPPTECSNVATVYT